MAGNCCRRSQDQFPVVLSRDMGAAVGSALCNLLCNVLCDVLWYILCYILCYIVPGFKTGA